LYRRPVKYPWRGLAWNKAQDVNRGRWPGIVLATGCLTAPAQDPVTIRVPVRVVEAQILSVAQTTAESELINAFALTLR
jgi:hypothetical protein